jgi:hypothetical protein
MVDLRTVETLSPLTLSDGGYWRNCAFAWKRWGPSTHRWEHDHCRFCNACICDARDHRPHDKPGPVEGGHYRHAFYAEEKDGVHIWVCRTCFKRLRSRFGWTIVRSRPSAASDFLRSDS